MAHKVNEYKGKCHHCRREVPRHKGTIWPVPYEMDEPVVMPCGTIATQGIGYEAVHLDCAEILKRKHEEKRQHAPN